MFISNIELFLLLLKKEKREKKNYFVIFIIELELKLNLYHADYAKY